MADRVGQQLGNYRLTHLIGRGGFAEVYLGEHVRLGTQTAVKVLHTRLVENDEVERFQQEARTIAHLDHPHIVRVLDFDVQEDIPFLIMGYAPHGNLRKRHPRGIPLALSTVVDYIKQVVDALQYAHDQKVIHRDIKPENMLVGRRNEILLSDFGIALLAQSSRLQSIQEVAGTAHYMAPEQLQGKPRLASDQYALGIVVYEWLGGSRPFEGSFTEIASQHMFVPPPPLSEKVPTILPEVEHIVLTALEKDPHRRFGSVQAFATALEQASQTAPSPPLALHTETTPPYGPSLPTQASAAILPSQSPLPTNVVTPPSYSLEPTNTVTPPNQSSQPAIAGTSSHTAAEEPPLTKESVPPDGLQPARRGLSRRTVVVGLAGITGLAVVGGGIAWVANSQRPQVSPPGPQPTATQTPPATLKNPIYTYHGHSATVKAVSWSPNGTRIASGSEDWTVQVWDATSGGNVVALRNTGNTMLAVAWSLDGKRIAAGERDAFGNVYMLDAISASTLFTYHDHSADVRSLAWSPNSKRIASAYSVSHHFDSQGVPVGVLVWNAADGSNTYTYKGHSGDVNAVAWSPDGTRIASGGDDNTVQVWDAVTGNHLHTYTGHAASVNAVTWSPDSKRIASGGDDNTVQVWQVV